MAALWEDSGRPKITASETPTSASAAAAAAYARRRRRARCRASFDQRLRVVALDRIVRLTEVASPGAAVEGGGDSHGLLLSNTIMLVLLSPMLNVKVRKDDPTDLYEQVAAEIRRAIADGEAKPGERLPPAKDLAAVLDVNTNTVFRALAPPPRRRPARVPPRTRHLRRRHPRTGRRRPAGTRARPLRPPARLPHRRAHRDHPGRRLTKPDKSTRWPRLTQRG